MTPFSTQNPLAARELSPVTPFTLPDELRHDEPVCRGALETLPIKCRRTDNVPRRRRRSLQPSRGPNSRETLETRREPAAIAVAAPSPSNGALARPLGTCGAPACSETREHLLPGR